MTSQPDAHDQDLAHALAQARRQAQSPAHAEAVDFVRRSTSARAVPLVPELTLRTVDDVIGLWQRTESRHGTRPDAADGEPPFWAFPWAGGQAVARYVLDRPELVNGRLVLDLACGGGLVAIAAARAGARVCAVDIDPLALAATELNATDNGVEVAVRAVDLLEDGRAGPAQAADGDEAEVVLAGDVFYARDFAARAFTFLRTCAARGADVLVGDPHRAYLPDHGLELLADYAVAVDADLEGVTSRRASVYRVLAPTRSEQP